MKSTPKNPIPGEESVASLVAAQEVGDQMPVHNSPPKSRSLLGKSDGTGQNHGSKKRCLKVETSTLNVTQNEHYSTFITGLYLEIFATLWVTKKLREN